ncbi:DUF4012 domain-containing protein [Candidatus Uhrbacteria bacterium]|nr:DUF4012 domain-containing protein [Candidatus Uhrbacteria bacterium]
MDIQHEAPTSRHLLRIIRPSPERTTPDFLDAVRTHIAPVRRHAGLVPGRVGDALRSAWARAHVPAPVLQIPTPYRDLLIASIVGGVAGVLWRSIIWPLASAVLVPQGIARVRLVCRGVEFPSRTRVLGALRPDVLRHAFRTLAFAPVRTSMIPLAAFALVLAVVILPFKLIGLKPELSTVRGRVLGATVDAVSAITMGGQALTESSFSDAAAAFARARDLLDALPDATVPGGAFGLRVGQYLPRVGPTIARANAARTAGIALTSASSAAARGLAMVSRVDLQSPGASALLAAARASFASAHTIVADARPAIDHVLPAQKPRIDAAMTSLQRAESLLPILGTLAGVDRPQRFLVVFQNPQELRPTGGFIGSFALVDVRRGRVTALELPHGGSYDVSGISRARVLPPEPLRLLQPTWQFQDANWFPDFPTTAQKLRWFYAQSSGPSVDAVLAVNAPVLETILALTGPITVDGQSYGASDVLTALTNTIESPTARATGAPKAVLAQLAPPLLERLLAITDTPGDQNTKLALLDTLLHALDRRDILLAFADDTVQRAVHAAGWSGAILPAPRDALMVVHANIGGGKSDARTSNDLIQETVIRADGTALDTVTITRTHRGATDTLDTPAGQLSAMANLDYLRVYVPRGAMLITADGFTAPAVSAFEAIPDDAVPDRDLLAVESNRTVDASAGITITEEFGRTVFGGWVRTPPNTAQRVRLTYQLPWTYARTTSTLFGRTERTVPQPYSLFVQRQPGTRPTFRHTITLESPWRATWVAPTLTPVDTHTWSVADILDADHFSGVMIAPR